MAKNIQTEANDFVEISQVITFIGRTLETYESLIATDQGINDLDSVLNLLERASTKLRGLSSLLDD
jgi:hypothetical protein